MGDCRFLAHEIEEGARKGRPYKALSLMLSYLTESRRRDRGGGWLQAGAVSAAGQTVTASSALQSSAVYACVRNTADTVASLPCVLRRLTVDDAGRRRSEEAANHPLYRVLLETPNAWQTAFEYWRTLVWHVQLRGNHYSRVLRNGAGRTTALEPLHPDRVRPYWTREGRPAYALQAAEGRPEILLPREVFHVRGPQEGDGLLGMTPVEIHRETIGMALAARDYGARFFANDARPSGVLTAPGLNDEGLARLKRDWGEAYGGGNRHGTAVLEDGVKFENIGMSNADAQFLELIGATDLQIARLWRIPPHKIGIKTQMTLNNIEHQNREWVTDTLMPLARSIEDAVCRDLLSAGARRSLTARFDFAELLRGDVKARTEANARGIRWGWFSPNEVREREGLNPIGPQGDVYVSPANMQSMRAAAAAEEEEDGHEV